MEAEHVLVAIAEWELRGACREALLAAGYRVTTASTEDAARYMLDAPRPPGVVLLCSQEPLALTVRASLERSPARPGLALVALPSELLPDGAALLAAVERALVV